MADKPFERDLKTLAVELRFVTKMSKRYLKTWFELMETRFDIYLKGKSPLDDKRILAGMTAREQETVQKMDQGILMAHATLAQAKAYASELGMQESWQQDIDVLDILFRHFHECVGVIHRRHRSEARWIMGQGFGNRESRRRAFRGNYETSFGYELGLYVKLTSELDSSTMMDRLRDLKSEGRKAMAKQMTSLGMILTSTATLWKYFDEIVRTLAGNKIKKVMRNLERIQAQAT